MATRWDPTAYARFGDERQRPFHDLLARVGATRPGLVVDLGCGNGPTTLALADRWPDARVVGVDNSPEMLEAARALDRLGRVEWVLGDLADWKPSSLGVTPDVIVSNAALQWVPGYLDLLGPWAEALADGGWLGFQVPANFDAPSHVLMREVARTQPQGQRILDALRLPRSDTAADHLAALSGTGRALDVWETTYLHVLDPEGRIDNPVLDWVSGTGLRPALQALTDEGERTAYKEAYAAALAQAYPRTEVGVVLPFRRIFAIAHKAYHETA